MTTSRHGAIAGTRDLHVNGIGMQNPNEPKRTFLNRRDWGSYLSALQSAATYPKVIDAVKSGRDWFTQSATHASNWLAATAELAEKLTPEHS